MMKLGTAVTILDKVYKPLDQWGNSEKIPNELLENKTIQEAWDVVEKSRKKCVRVRRKARRTYRSSAFEKLEPRKNEIAEDIKHGLTLKEMNEKYGVSNIYLHFERLGIRTLYRRELFIQRAIYACKNDRVIVFDNIKDVYKHFHVGKNNFMLKCLDGDEELNGYSFFRYREFIEFYSEHEEFFEQLFWERNL